MMKRKFEIQRTIIKRKVKILERLLDDIEKIRPIKRKEAKDDLQLLVDDLAIVRKGLEEDVVEYEKLKDECAEDEWQDEQEEYEYINILIDSILLDVELETERALYYIKKAKSRGQVITVECQPEPRNFASDGNAKNKCNASESSQQRSDIVDYTPREKGVSKSNKTNLDMKDDISNFEEIAPEEVKNNSGKNSDKNPDKNPDEESSMRPKESHEDSQDVQIKSNDGDDESINEVIDVLVDKIDNETCCPEGKLSLNVVVDEVPIIKEEIWTDPNECNGNPCEKFEDDDQTKADTSGSMTNAFINDQDIQRWLKNNSKKKELYYKQEFYEKNDEQRWIKNKCKKKRSLKGKNLNKLQIGFRKRLKKNKKRKRCFNEKRYNYISSEAKWARNHARKKSTRYFLNEKEEKWLKNMKKKKRTKTPTTIVTWMIYDHVDNNNNGLQEDDILMAPGAQTRTCRAEANQSNNNKKYTLV